MYDLVLIHPPRVPRFAPEGNQFAVMPVGLMSLATELKHAGYQVRIFNLGMEASINPNFDLKSRLRKIEANVYGIDFQWFVHAYGVSVVAETIKSLRPSAKVVVGGMSASWFASELCKEKYVDAVVTGEGEQTLKELVDRWERSKTLDEVKGIAYRDGGKVRFTPPRPPVSFEVFSTYDFTMLNLIDDYQAYLGMGGKAPNFWLPIARGCPYNCTYCGGSREGYAAAMGRQATIFRDPVAVANDMEKLSKYGVKVVSFTHDPEIGGERYWSPLLKEISSRVSDVGIYIESFRVPSEKFMRSLSGVVGSSLAVSPESASEEVRRFNGRNVTDDQMFRSLEVAKSLGIPVLVYFLIGLPREDWQTFSLFEPMVRKIIQGRFGFVVPPIPYTMDPNSPMAMRPSDFGVKPLLRTYSDYKNMSSSNDEKKWIAHETKWLSRDDIYDMLLKARQILASFYGNPKFVTFD